MQVKQGMAERELDLVNLAVDGAHIWEDDPAVREQHYQVALAHMAATEALGAKTLRIDAGGGREDRHFTDEQFDHIVKRYKEYARRATDNGYRVGPENHWGSEAVPEEVVRLCQAVDSPAFGVLLHTRRWFGEHAAEGDAMVAPWTMHTHLTTNVTDEALAAPWRCCGTRAMRALGHRDGRRQLRRGRRRPRAGEQGPGGLAAGLGSPHGFGARVSASQQPRVAVLWGAELHSATGQLDA